MFGVDAANWGQDRRPSHRAVIAAAAASLGSVDTERFNRLKLMREKADYVGDPAHPELQRLFADYNAHDWADLAGEALTLARALLPRLRELPPAP